MIHKMTTVKRSESLTVELNRLESEWKMRLEEFTAYKEPDSIPDATEFDSFMLLNSIIFDIVKLSCIIQRKTIDLIELHKEEVREIERNIELHSREMNTKRRGRKKEHKRGRKHRKRVRETFFGDDAEFRSYNGARSLYFKLKSDACFHDNDDLMSIHQSGYKFLSCLHVPRVWTESESNRLLDAVRNEVKYSHLDELKDLYLRLQSTDEPEIVSSSVQRASELMNHSIDLSETISTVLQSEFAKQLDWDRLKNRNCFERHTPEELQAIWTLVANPNVRRYRWTVEEDILLRHLATDYNFQNWQAINELMPRPRNEFLCFSRYVSVFKRKPRITHPRIEEKNSMFSRKFVFEKSMAAFHDTDARKRVKARLTRSNIMEGKKRGRFSKREKFVANAYLRRGFSFQTVASILKNRSPAQLRDHYYHQIGLGKVANWSTQEDRDLLSALRHWGKEDWGRISESVHSRTRYQCRRRYYQLLRKRKSYVEEMVNRKFESTLDMLRDIRNFIRRVKRKKSRKGRVDLDRKLDSYFLLQLDGGVKKSNQTELLSVHVIRLLQSLDFNVSCSTEYAAELNNWLIQYPSSSSQSALNCDKLLVSNFQEVKSEMKKLPMKTLPNMFSSMIIARNVVMPPNKCTFYGLHQFMREFQNFAKRNESLNFEMLWKDQNVKMSRKKYFVESKILWYRVLKMMFFWPLKLKSFMPEQLL